MRSLNSTPKVTPLPTIQPTRVSDSPPPVILEFFDQPPPDQQDYFASENIIMPTIQMETPVFLEAFDMGPPDEDFPEFRASAERPPDLQRFLSPPPPEVKVIPATPPAKRPTTPRATHTPKKKTVNSKENSPKTPKTPKEKKNDKKKTPKSEKKSEKKPVQMKNQTPQKEVEPPPPEGSNHPAVLQTFYLIASEKKSKKVNFPPFSGGISAEIPICLPESEDFEELEEQAQSCAPTYSVLNLNYLQ